MKREPSNEDAIKLQAHAPEGVAKQFVFVETLSQAFYRVYIVYRGREVPEETRKRVTLVTQWYASVLHKETTKEQEQENQVLGCLLSTIKT